MNWQKSMQSLPANNEEVLVRQGKYGTIYMAVYTELNGEFTLADGKAIKKSEEVTWVQIGPPSREPAL
jgi:hypothetical protein